MHEQINILLYITNYDKSFIPGLKGIFPSWVKVFVRTEFSSLMAVKVAAMQHKCTRIITCNAKFLDELVNKEGWDGTGERPSIENYQGSLFHYQDLEIVIVPGLQQLFTVNHGKFVFKRFASKLFEPESWIKQTKFTWELATEETIEELYEQFKSCIYIAIDIETNRWVNAIDSISYCGVWWDETAKEYRTHSIVFEPNSMYWVAWMRKFNTLDAEKIFQNGKFDNFFLFMYNAVPTNWLWDTIDLFHCWYAELPKSLDFQSAFLVRDFKYWKHESSKGREARLQYNAKDTWVTAMAFLAGIRDMPQWALDNYVIEFPLIPACLYCELQGVRADKDKLEENRKVIEAQANELLTSLQKMVDKNFNPRSHVQVKKLMTVLGHKDCDSTKEAILQKLAFKDPLTGLLVEKILDYRGLAKLISTYLVPEKLYKGRIFFALNPFGTTTGRLASKEGQLSYISYKDKKSGEPKNVGLQIQNIPNRDEEAKLVREYFLADNGFLWFGGDYEQAEARDTGYLSGDTNLIAAVDGYLDFHAINASAFFGIPYEKIVETTVAEKDAITGKVLRAYHKTINKLIRNLAKRVNHGSNYNMGPETLVLTMGLKNIFTARNLLQLPTYWGALQVAKYLLGRYEATYPIVKGAWYKKIISDVNNTRKLVGPTGWTRYCFGKPEKSKLDMNAYAAHPPQSLNAMTLNKAFKRVFYELLPDHHENFRLKMQIHDEIVGQYRIGHEYIVDMVSNLMVFPVSVSDTFGIVRELVVPVAVNKGKERWSELK